MEKLNLTKRVAVFLSEKVQILKVYINFLNLKI